MIATIEQHHATIVGLCRQFGVRRLDLFGSATTNQFDLASSDLDFLVDFADRSPGYARRFFAFEAALGQLLGHEVDLVTEHSVRNPYLRASIEETRVPIYEAKNRQEAA